MTTGVCVSVGSDTGVRVLVGWATGARGVSVGWGVSVARRGGKLEQLVAANVKISRPKVKRANDFLFSMGASFLLKSRGYAGRAKHRRLCISYHLFVFLASVTYSRRHVQFGSETRSGGCETRSGMCLSPLFGQTGQRGRHIQVRLGELGEHQIIKNVTREFLVSDGIETEATHGLL